MNLYNEDEKRDGAPVIPSGASSFKKSSAFGKPMFSRTAGGIMERLKNLSRKDMAFVGIGLSVLVMAPVAEYMTSKPSTDNLLTPGFGSREGSSATGGVYEPGINALSQGSPDGSGEVITPLSSRDPASLILGSQPAQPVMPPVTAPPSSSFRDSMKDVGRNAFSEAAKATGAPTPVPRMQSTLRNVGSFFSGGEGSRTGGTMGGGKIIDDARSASSKAAGRSMVGPVATAGYRGVASNTPNSSSKGAYEKLRSQADRSASNFSGTSAMNSLDKAASDAIDIGKGGGGLGAGGDSEKTGKPSNSTTKYDHSRSGETLEEAAAKLRQQKALDWEFFKKYEIKKQIITAIVGAVSTSIGKFVGDSIDGVLNPSGPAPKCWNPPICSDGVSCGGIAVTYLGAKWWENGKKLSDLCSIAGAPVAYGTKVGKESSSTTQEVCICGKGGSPSSGAPAEGGTGGTGGTGDTGGPGNSTSSTPPQHSAAAVNSLKDYDGLLTDMVGYVTDTENSVKKSTDSLTSFVGAVQNLSPLAKAKSNKLGNLRDAAESELTGFKTKLEASQAKMTVVQPKYGAFAKQVNEISKLCKNKDDCKLDMNRDAELSAKTEMTPDTKLNILDLLQQWNDSGVFVFNSAQGNLEAQRKWAGAYSSQLPPIRTGIEVIEVRQANIEAEVSRIYGDEKLTSVGKLKQLSGRLEKVEDATPTPKADTPLQLLAVNQRALDWAKLWESNKHEMIATAVSEKEATEFQTWVGEVGKAANSAAISVPSTPENLINNQMRSTQLQSHIKGQLTNFTSIDGDLDKTSAAVDVIKKALMSYLDPKYFGGAAIESPKPDAAKPDAAKPDAAKPTATESVKPNPNAATPEQAKQAAAYKAILEDCHTYGVGTENGANHCSVKQSDVIKKATEGAAMDRVDTSALTKRDIATLRGNVQHACAALKGCNMDGYISARCFTK